MNSFLAEGVRSHILIMRFWILPGLRWREKRTYRHQKLQLGHRQRPLLVDLDNHTPVTSFQAPPTTPEAQGIRSILQQKTIPRRWTSLYRRPRWRFSQDFSGTTVNALTANNRAWLIFAFFVFSSKHRHMHRCAHGPNATSDRHCVCHHWANFPTGRFEVFFFIGALDSGGVAHLQATGRTMTRSALHATRSCGGCRHGTGNTQSRLLIL